MPFPKWAVEPVFLVRKPLPPDKVEPCNFYPVINASLVSCLKQLSSVAKIADRIFEEIACECRQVAERTERIKDKIHSCQIVVSKLNARAVQVPVSDLDTTARFLRSEKPYVTVHEQSSHLFLPSTRPPCVDQLYASASATPVPLMCTIDRYRTDGLSASDLFMVTPVLGGEGRKKKKRLLDIETRKPANFSLAGSNQDRIESGSASLPPLMLPSRGYILKQNENLELDRLPSPEEQAMLVSLEYPSTIVPVDTSGTSFSRMSLMRRSLIHVDFIIKHKKSKKKKSKRRHTFCEGQNRELDQAIRNVTNTSCQTDDTMDTTTSSTASTLLRMTSRRRSRSVQDNSRRVVDLEAMEKDSATEEDKEASPSKPTPTLKKPFSFNPLSSLSAAIVKMRTSTSRKQDDGRSSSGNWSASSSTRASVDSSNDHQAALVADGVSSPSRSSIGKDSLLSDATQQDPHNRSRDDILPIQMLTHSPVKKKKFAHIKLPWETNRTSNTSTPESTSNSTVRSPYACRRGVTSDDGDSSVRSPYAGRRGVTSDDGDSSVYSVDTDGYYTSMHTDSGLWCNALLPDDLKSDGAAEFRQRKESQSSVSTNSSINSFLSKSATECSSNSGSFKDKSSCPPPPMRVSSRKVSQDSVIFRDIDVPQDAAVSQELEDSDKSYSPHPPNGSNSESEHEVRDRIRFKTAITPHRYPSMCAVSPETSDDEIHDLKRRTVVPNVNVVVAEIHREERLYDSDSKGKSIKTEERRLTTETEDIEQVPKPNSHLQHSSAINMYRCETPVPSNFSSSILSSQPVSSSTPRSGITVTTFSQEFNDTINPNTKGNAFELGSKLSVHSNEVKVVDKPVSSLPKTDKTLIPLKYAQRITVTPIARSDSTSSCTGTIKRTPLKQLSSNESRSETKSLLSCIKADATPSYVSFKAPDSPVSSLASFKIGSEGQPTSPTGSLSRPVASPTGSLMRPIASPTGSLSRPVARVTLDPTGKVVYTSNSLERSRTVSPNHSNLESQSYATLPMSQNHHFPRSTTPIGNKFAMPVNTRCITPTNNRSTTPVNNRSTTPVNNRSTTPVNNRCITPTNNRSTTPVNNRSTTPANNRAKTPVNNRSTTPVNNRSTTPINTRSTTPVNNRSTTPVNYRSTTPVNNRSTTPVNNRSTTPVNNRSSNPVSNRSSTPVNHKSTTPVQSRSPTPVSNKSTTQITNRSTTPINFRSTEVRSGSSPLVNNIYTNPINNTDSNRCTPNSNMFANAVNNRITTTVNSSTSINSRSIPINRQTMSILTRSENPTREVQNKHTKDLNAIDQIDSCDRPLSKISTQPPPELNMHKQAPQYQFSSFRSSNTGNDFNFRPSRGGRFCRSYFPSHLISSPSDQTSNGNSSPTASSPSTSPATIRVPHAINTSSKSLHDHSAGRNYLRSNSHASFPQNQNSNLNQPSTFNSLHFMPSSSDVKPEQTSNPPIWPNRYNSSSANNKYLGSNLNSAPRSNVLIHGPPSYAEPRTHLNSQPLLSPPDLIPSGQSPPSTLDVTSSARKTFSADNISNDGDKKSIKNLSANELFAIIHNSKKRHNIKSESELSMSPMSSRSVSPALSQSSMSKLQPVETGVLSRRYDNSPDKSKWCNSLPSHRKPMFPEKLATKPTSMHDFKMLLLQTRTGSQDNSPRPSAAELLKVSPPKSTSPMPSPTFKPVVSHSTGGTYSPGHGTVPLKRSMRTRSPYLTRYDSVYPPIIEDCCEEMESYEDSKCLASDNLPYQSLNNNYDPSLQTSTAPLAKATSTWV